MTPLIPTMVIVRKCNTRAAARRVLRELASAEGFLGGRARGRKMIAVFEVAGGEPAPLRLFVEMPPRMGVLR